MAKVIIVTFGKSDVGRTTSTGALSAALALQGWHGGAQRGQNYRLLV
jgi:septum formation inhibitor-activating ATPase MinD